MIKTVRNMVMASIAAVALAFGGGSAWAGLDRVTLTDGTEVEGEIVRELSGAVWLKVKDGTVERERFFGPDEVASVERDVAALPEARRRGSAPSDEEERSYPPGTPRGIVITLEGTVGISFSSDQMSALVEDIERAVGDDGTGIVVFKINSGGGLLADIERISDVIEYEYKPKFRTVAWIESAISAAAMSAHTLEEIYFFPEGNYGACTGFSGALVAMAGRGWAETAFLMERISSRGGYDPKVMYAMMGNRDQDLPLSARRNPETGEVEWAQEVGLEGYTTLNPPGEVLTLNSVQATEWDFADGIATNVDDLTRLMGYQEVHWLGRYEEGVRYPVSSVERKNRQWRARIAEDEQHAAVTMALYQEYKNQANGAPLDVRGVFVGKARDKLRTIKRLVDMNSLMSLMTVGMPPELFDEWYEEEEELLREIARAGR